MNRRQLLKSLIPGSLIPGFLASNVFAGENIKDFGYRPKQLGPTDQVLTSSILPRVALLYQYKRIIPHNQKSNPDCTAHAAAIAVEILNSIEHYLLGKPLGGEVVTEWLYAKALKNRKSGGTAVDDIVDVLKEGFLWRKKYPSIDLSRYNFQNWKRLAQAKLEPASKILESTRVASWNEASSAIKNLQPVIIGSDVGFDRARKDSDGFVKSKGKWAHAWCLIGIDDKFHRPGGLLLSSHGPDWPPRSTKSRHNQPDGSAWVDANTLDKMLSKYGDCFAINNIQESRTNDSMNKVICYMSPDCSPCQAYKPIIAQFPEIVTVEHGHNVSPVPQVWIVRDNEVTTLIGLRTKQELANFLRKHG